MKKHHKGALLMGAGVLIIALLMARPQPDAAAVAPVAALTVTTTTLISQPLQRTLAATGSVHAWQELVIAPQLGGYRVEAVKVDIGHTVKAGQELARLDDGLLASEVNARRAAVNKSQALADKAEADYRRAQTLEARKLLSTADLERRHSDWLAAQADSELARANLDSAELNLKNARITAPAAGVISARSVNLGEIAQVGKAMFRLLRDNRIEWRAEVPESQLLQLRAGQSVRVHTADGKSLTGTLRSIDPTVDANKRNATVYVDLPQPGGARPGMFARGEFLLDNAAASTIPLASVVRSDGYSYVFAVGKDRIVQRRRVETGALAGDRIEVVRGLAGGEVIVHSGAAFLKDGDRVDVASSDGAPKTAPKAVKIP